MDCVAQVPIVEVVRWGTLLVSGASPRWQALVLLWSTQAVAAEPRHAAQVGGLQGGTVALAFRAAGLFEILQGMPSGGVAGAGIPWVPGGNPLGGGRVSRGWWARVP